MTLSKDHLLGMAVKKTLTDDWEILEQLQTIERSNTTWDLIEVYHTNVPCCQDLGLTGDTRAYFPPHRMPAMYKQIVRT